jgi:uncharacterized protein YjbI with pentapeptide repeats
MQQDFTNQKLRGQSFKRQDLTGIDFSGADIRSTDFSHANLVGANFSRARAGQKFSWIIGLTFCTLLTELLIGFLTTYGCALISSLMFFVDAQPAGFWLGIIAFISLGLFVLTSLRRGPGIELGAVAICITLIVAVIAAVNQNDSAAGAAIIQAIGIAIAFSGVAIGAINLSIIRFLTGKIALSIAVILFLFGGVAGALEGVRGKDISISQDLAIAGLAAIILLALSIYISGQAISGNTKYLRIRKLAIFISAQGGTSFREANLTDVNFTQATLTSVDFRKAILSRTCWFQASGLRQSQIEETYLGNSKIQQLVVTRNGQEHNYDKLNLSGVNLENANLKDASFIGSSFDEAILKGADLAGAKLVQTQLYTANLMDACLTGAYIQNWGISPDTQLKYVKCDYIYMQLPSRDDPDPCRKPDNRQETFKEGEFEEFISPIIKTLDLYRQQGVDPRKVGKTYKSLDLFHHEGIDPSAAAIALKQLAEQYPEAGLEVVALEGRGDEKIRLQARVTGQADRSQLSAEYFTKYQEAAALPYSDMQSLLAAMAEKDQRIRSLENMVMTSMQSDKFYVETYYDLGKRDDETAPVRKILILTANPKNTSKLRLDAEVREIQTGLERAKKRDQFEIITKWAVRPEDLRRALLDYEPQIVHFSGHGTATEGLALENETGQTQLVSTHALASLFEVFKDKVECVLLNACYSVEQAEAIRQHIPYVIGMNHEIGDRAALEFAVGFYDALGAGRSIDDAFKLGCISIDLEGIPEALTPVLKHKD